MCSCAGGNNVYMTSVDDAYNKRALQSTGTLLLPVRGPPPPMPQLGYLSHEFKKDVIALYGMPTYSRSSQYEYYVEMTNGGRIPLCTDPNRILWTGDIVSIPAQPGAWTVTLYEPRRYGY